MKIKPVFPVRLQKVCTFLLLPISFFLLPFSLSAQVPESFNYQAVVRDNGQLLKNTSIDVRLTILQGTESGTAVWTETQNVGTNDYGLFTLKAGNIMPVDIDWSAGPYYLKVETDLKDGNGFIVMGTTALISVPYALYAKDVANKDDSDADPTNEIQDLQLNGNLLSLSLKGSPTIIDLSDYIDDADADPVNEIQDLQLNGNILTITKYGSATQIDLTPYLDNPGWIKSGTDTLSYPGSVGVGTEQPGGSKLSVQGDDILSDKPLFEVKRKDGQTVFAVYNDSIRMYVNADESAKGRIGGIAIGGFNTTKGGPVTNFLDLTPDNYFIGYQSGSNITSGRYNSFLGYQSGISTTEGSGNSFFGYLSGFHNTSGQNNLFLGVQSGYENTTGSDNTFLGLNSGMANTTGVDNSFMGSYSGSSNTGGNGNSFVGKEAGSLNTTGNNNSFFGYRAGYNNITGLYNVFLGYQSGYSNASGAANVFIGTQAGYSNTANHNVFLGYESGRNNTTGSQNAFMGFGAGRSNTTGICNTFIGSYAGFSNSIGTHNLFMGYAAGYNTNASDNVFLGYFSGQENTTGSNNVFIGTNAGYANTTASGNVFIGFRAGYLNTTSSGNVLIGDQSGANLQTGSENVMIGKEAGYNNVTGNRNVFIGNEAGYGVTGSDRLCIGPNNFIYGEFDNSYLRILADLDVLASDADVAEIKARGSSQGAGIFYLGQSDTYGGGISYDGDGSPDIIGDNDRITFFRRASGVDYEVMSYGYNNPDVVHAARVFATAFVTTSDKRLKKEITTIEDPMEKIMALRGVEFFWKQHKDTPYEFLNQKQIGFIAQEVEEVLPSLVGKDFKGFKTVSYGNVSALLVEAIKVQQNQIENQQKEIDRLTEANKKLILLEKQIEELRRLLDVAER